MRLARISVSDPDTLTEAAMKPVKTKRQLRAELDQQLADYLREGGEVKEVPRGISGRFDAKGPLTPLFTPTKDENPLAGRTPLTHVVQALEARKHPVPVPKRPKPKRPRKKMILDDFGQPVRWEWVED